jgi:hypothetical protein
MVHSLTPEQLALGNGGGAGVRPGNGGVKGDPFCPIDSMPRRVGQDAVSIVTRSIDHHRMAEGKGIEMRGQKRSMRPHEKGLAALFALLISIITMRALRFRFTEWLKQGKSK